MASLLTETFESLYQWAKRWQRRYRFAEYADLELTRGWEAGASPSGVTVRDFPAKIAPADAKSVLIFKPDEIGDAVMALPALKKLREQLATSSITVACHFATKEIYERSGLVDKVIPVRIRRWGSFWNSVDLQSIEKEAPSGGYDVAVFLKTFPRFFRSFLKVPAKIHIHPRDPRMRSRSLFQPRVSVWGSHRAHQTVQLMEIIEPLLVRKYALADVAFPQLNWTEEDKTSLPILFNRRVPERYFVVHPYAGCETRTYPMAYWPSIIRSLQEEWGIPVVIFGGPKDKKLEGLKGVIQVQGRMKLSETAYVLSRATAFFGNLSGPSHLAAALGVPNVCFFGGQSLVQEWAPLGKSLLLRRPVSCSPCYRRTCAEYQTACLTQLSPEVVLPEIRRFLRRTAGLMEQRVATSEIASPELRP